MSKFQKYLEAAEKEKCKCEKCGKKISEQDYNMNSHKCNRCKDKEIAAAERATGVE